MYFSKEITFILLIFTVFNAADAIYYGDTAVAGSFKYMARVLSYFSGHLMSCGGTIISKRHILTAAHCISERKIEQMAVISGSVRTNDWQSVVISHVENAHVHPSYSPRKKLSWLKIILWYFFPDFIDHPEESVATQNDIGILTVISRLFMWESREVITIDKEFRHKVISKELDKDLPIGGNIEIVDLPIYDMLPYCIDLDYAGWGETENSSLPSSLKTAQFEILTSQECAEMGGWHRKNEFCALSLNRRSRIALGDSGSPLVFMNVVYGITSSACSNPEIPCTFTKVYSHEAFIKNVLMT